MARSKANKNTGLKGAIASMIVEGLTQAPAPKAKKKKDAPAPPAQRKGKVKQEAPPAPPVKEANRGLDGRIHKSAVEKPCVAVWELCNELVVKQGLKRKDVLEAASKMGIAFYTARTQYQAWLSAYKAS